MSGKIRIIWPSRVGPLSGTTWNLEVHEVEGGLCEISLSFERENLMGETQKKSIWFSDRVTSFSIIDPNRLIIGYCAEERFLLRFQSEGLNAWAEVLFEDLSDFLEIRVYQPFIRFGGQW